MTSIDMVYCICIHSISFMGGGQLWMFAIGAGHYVYETYDTNKIKILASSSV
jgi:hypothetical protein